MTAKFKVKSNDTNKQLAKLGYIWEIIEALLPLTSINI